MTYLSEFQQAVAYSQQLGVKPDMTFAQERLLVPKNLEAIPYMVRDVLGELTPADLVAQCLSIHLRLVPVLEKVFGVQPAFTIGYIKSGSTFRFKTLDNYFSELAANGLGTRTFEAHAWLTLPSMEILDFSLPTSMALINGWTEGEGMVLSGHADELKHNLSYHPQLVGAEFINKLGLIWTTS
ncbi:hypothetical protein LU699_16575 [Luteimonas fraxinea]|uniref:hypothetical protein n=1 Tax=Luteimonas fraxinea TaxID=2901869 RepID=UPI001E6353AB|nr:hypothetical protein [Luteimonas fraxinea]UHH09849.1 hypothetical protein LU699_16575 [Luteimonas fraxinea]